jgi:hypothetical protein
MTRVEAVARLLEKRDEEILFQMARSSPMKLPGLELVYDRSPDFQKLLQCQGEGFESHVGDVGNDIVGVASISWKTRQHQGKKVGVGYLGDLRMKKTLASARVWRDFYSTVLSEDFKKKRGIQYFITAVLAENRLALQNLTKSKRNDFVYHPMGTQTMVNVIARKPFQSTVLGEIKKIAVSQLEKSQFDLIQKASEKKSFAYNWSADENAFRMQYWPDWKEAQALVAENSLCIPWSPSKAKRMQVQSLSWGLRWFLLWTRAFGFPKLEQGGNLETTYLTTLNFHPDLKREAKVKDLIKMIETVLNQKSRPHMVSFADVDSLSSEKEFSARFIVQKTEVLLFQVTRKDEPALPQPEYPLDFEMALV